MRYGAWSMFSMPPATATLMLPREISCAAETMACAPEPQTRLTLSAGIVTGSPAWTAACRAGFIFVPACTTLPMTTASTSSGRSFARATAAPIATAPRVGAGTSLRLPPKVPIAVRTGAARTIERDARMRDLLHPYPAAASADAFAAERQSFVPPIDNQRSCTHIGAYALVFKERTADGLRAPAESRGLQLPGATRSDPARHAILRSIAGPKRPAHHPILNSD